MKINYGVCEERDLGACSEGQTKRPTLPRGSTTQKVKVHCHRNGAMTTEVPYGGCDRREQEQSPYQWSPPTVSSAPSTCCGVCYSPDRTRAPSPRAPSPCCVQTTSPRCRSSPPPLCRPRAASSRKVPPPCSWPARETAGTRYPGAGNTHRKPHAHIYY